MIDACCTQSDVVNSGVTGPNLTKFLYNVKESLLFNFLQSESKFANPFRNASKTNEGEVGHFANLATKLVAMATSLEQIFLWCTHVHSDSCLLFQKRSKSMQDVAEKPRWTENKTRFIAKPDST